MHIFRPILFITAQRYRLLARYVRWCFTETVETAKRRITQTVGARQPMQGL